MFLFQFISLGLVLGYFYVTEVYFRVGKGRETQRTETDRGTSLILWVAVIPLVLVLPFLVHFGVIRIDFLQFHSLHWLIWFPLLLLQVTGLILRSWSMRVLGEYFSRTLVVREKQSLIYDGPYRYVRHPGYSANMLNWISFAFLMSLNLVVTFFLLVICLIGYEIRTTSEEEMLVQAFPEYQTLQTKTKKFIPFLY